MKELETKYMERAIELAKKGLGFTSPNPLVGAVIVKDGHIIGEGYHEKYGSLHAERNALASCTENPQGATMYVTLEPCCHHGKQPPCTEAIIQAGISKVVIGSADPNPVVSGKGISFLKKQGVTVIEGFLQKECDALNPVFFHYITHKMPFVSVKYAMTLDGKIASKTGNSKWITSEDARSFSHQLRTVHTGIMVGLGTIIADNPALTSHGRGKNPVRIVCDSNLRTPLTSQVVQTTAKAKTIIATCVNDKSRLAAYQKLGCEMLVVPKSTNCECEATETANHLDLTALLKELATYQIDSILVEGGGTLLWSFFKNGLVNKLYAYIAPKILGGKNAISPVGGLGFELVDEARKFKIESVRHFDNDILVEAVPSSISL